MGKQTKAQIKANCFIADSIRGENEKRDGFRPGGQLSPHGRRAAVGLSERDKTDDTFCGAKGVIEFCGKQVEQKQNETLVLP